MKNVIINNNQSINFFALYFTIIFIFRNIYKDNPYELILMKEYSIERI